MIQTVEAVVVSRKVKVPRYYAFRSWTEPDRLSRWLPAAGETCSVTTFELKAGGAYRFELSGGASAHVLQGLFVEVTAPEKLVFTWHRSGDEADHAESLVTVTFADIPGGTEIQVRHELLDSEEAAEAAFQKWNDWLGRNTTLTGMDFMMEETMMTTTLETGWEAKIENEKHALERAMARLYDTFSHVPDDKLNHKPTETARSPLHVAAHTGLTNVFFAKVISTGQLPDPNEVLQARTTGDAHLQTFTTRDQVTDLLKRSHEELKEAYDKVSIPALEANPRLQFFATLPAYHTVNHAAQIDYLQTMWGDLEDHFGM